jgi:cytochrome c oxidase subunit 2
MKKCLALLAVLAAVLSMTSLVVSTTKAQAVPRRIEVTARRFAFTPGEITLKVNQPVVLVLTSEDVAHGLKFSELKLNVRFDKTKPAELSFTPEKTGTFVGHCSVFCGSGHGTMTLTLLVEE